MSEPATPLDGPPAPQYGRSPSFPNGSPHPYVATVNRYDTCWQCGRSKHDAVHEAVPEPAVGWWQQACERNRVDGAIRVAVAAAETAARMVHECEHLPPTLVAQLLSQIGAGGDNLGDAEATLRLSA